MRVQIEEAQVKIDLRDARENIAAFNKSAAYLAGDWLMHEFFGQFRDGRQKQPACVCAVLVDALWNTRVDAEPGTKQREPYEKPMNHICCDIEANGKRLRRLSLDLGREALLRFPERVAEVAGESLELVGIAEGAARRNYSFATKFLHWLAPANFPVVDSRARKSINRLLSGQGQNCPGSFVTGQARSCVVSDYRRWIWFYHHLVAAATDDGWGLRLVAHDYDSQAGGPVGQRQNTLLRVLDKHFWMAASPRAEAHVE